METRTCQNCKNDFTIDAEDFNFYEKLKVPPPTFCAGCRQQRRYAWRNERTLYRRNCDLCGRSTVAIYSPNKPHKVYCNECWWSDGWDPKEYGMDFDFSRPFFEQFQEFLLKVPRQALFIKNCVNSDYTHHSGDNRNCYYSFSIMKSENVMYSTNIYYNMRDSADCYHATEGTNERHYECIDIFNSYQCQFCFFVKDCSNCFYSYDLRNCSNCFLSANLRNKSYFFLNEQLTREEYLKKIEEYNLCSSVVREKLYESFLEMMRDAAIHKYSFSQQAINCTGNFMLNCKNGKNIFDANEVEDSKNLFVAPDCKDSMDCYHIGFKTDLCYEIHAVIRSSNVHFTNLSYDNFNIDYCDSCHNSSELFGCIGVKKGSYMIFNKQYSKDEYLVLKEKIIEQMKNTREYGEFFPAKLSPFGYNETQGEVYEPLSKEEALALGFNWEDASRGIYGKETLKPDEVEDDIKNVGDSILKEVLRCKNCTKNYNIIPQELQFYRHENIPLPKFCPDCRYKMRIKLRSSRKLWPGKCKCANPNHGHDGRCPNEFETVYSSERVEKVYCESCYNKEIY